MDSILLSQIADTTAVYNERTAIILGLVALVLGLAVFFSCRICVSWLSRLGLKNLMQARGFSRFYQYHLYYWWAFGVLVVAHFMVSVSHTGLPQSSDPDASIHWIILGLGFFSFIGAVVLFSSCRILPGLVSMATPRSPFDNPFYKNYYKYHSYYWWILALLVAAHFAVSYNHAGLWPGR